MFRVLLSLIIPFPLCLDNTPLVAEEWLYVLEAFKIHTFFSVLKSVSD